MISGNEIKVFDYSKSVFASNLGALRKLRSLLFKYGDIDKIIMCPVCFGHISRWVAVEDFRSEWVSELVDIKLVLCSTCGWYRYETFNWEDFPYCEVIQRIAVLSKHSDINEEPPIQELRRYLTKHWENRAMLSPSKAEQIIADIFKEHLDCEVRYTSNGVYSPDGGIDFVLVNTTSGIEYAFQVKRRLTDSPERIQPIREFIGAVASKPFKYGYYVTTAPRLTKAAQREINTAMPHLADRGIQLNVVNGDSILTLLNSQVALPNTASVIRSKFILAKEWKLVYQRGKNFKDYDATHREFSLDEMLTYAFTNK